VTRLDFTGQIALITGGAGSIGRAVAKGFLEGGAEKVILLDLEDAALQAAADEVGGGEKSRVQLVRADLRDVSATRTAVRGALEAAGRVDILFNNAGLNRRKPAVEITEDDWDLVLGVNLKGLFFLTQEVGRHMLARGSGAVVSTASVSSVRGHKNLAAYAASKGGIAQLTRVLANEWASRGVRVNAVAPGYLVTGLTRDYLSDPKIREGILAKIPLGRIGEPEDVVGAVLFLASDLARYVTGEVLFVDGGRTVD
jgi:NAD(P)-dependent dehydrogenase (short-subunit alcohol dehydrogenase family)